MPSLIAIGYPDTRTAHVGMEEIERLSQDFIIRSDEIASISLNDSGTFKIFTNASIARYSGDKTTWAIFWEVLFALLYLAPPRMPVGTALGAIIEGVRQSGIDPEFLDRARHMLGRGTSVLFLIVEKVPSDQVVGALDELGGTVLQSSLSPNAVDTLQDVLQGRRAVHV